MEIVKPTANLETLNKNIKDDFYKVPNLSFDIEVQNLKHSSWLLDVWHHEDLNV